jgi:hypothetical protein
MGLHLLSPIKQYCGHFDISFLHLHKNFWSPENMSIFPFLVSWTHFLPGRQKECISLNVWILDVVGLIHPNSESSFPRISPKNDLDSVGWEKGKDSLLLQQFLCKSFKIVETPQELNVCGCVGCILKENREGYKWFWDRRSGPKWELWKGEHKRKKMALDPNFNKKVPKPVLQILLSGAKPSVKDALLFFCQHKGEVCK